MDKTSFDQLVKTNLRTYDSFWKIAKGQGGNYKTDFLRDYNYFKDYYKMTATDLSKQQALDADPKAIEQINFRGNLQNNARIFFIIEEAMETILDISQGIVIVL